MGATNDRERFCIVVSFGRLDVHIALRCSIEVCLFCVCKVKLQTFAMAGPWSCPFAEQDALRCQRRRACENKFRSSCALIPHATQRAQHSGSLRPRLLHMTNLPFKIYSSGSQRAALMDTPPVALGRSSEAYSSLYDGLCVQLMCTRMPSARLTSDCFGDMADIRSRPRNS